LYGSLLLGDLHQGPLGTRLESAIDWIVFGPRSIASRNADKTQVSHCISECDTNSLLRKSWADEKIYVKPIVHHVDCASEWELPHQYSNWFRLVRRTVYARRFIGNSKRKKNSQSGKESLIELREATQFWFRLVQKAFFPKEWNALSNNAPILKSNSPKALNPMVEGDSFTLGGRLRNTAVGYRIKNSKFHLRRVIGSVH